MRIGRRFFQTTATPSMAALSLAGRSITLATESAPEDSEWPNETNTGPTSDIADLTVMNGNVTISTPGTTLQNFYLNGKIRVTAPNVTIRNFVIHFTGFDQDQAIWCNNGTATNLTIEDGEIFSDMVNTARMTIGVYGNNWTARRLHVHHSWADGFRPVNDCTLEDSYVHSLGDVASRQHADAVQMLIGTNFTCTGCNFEIPNEEEPEDKPPGSFMNSAGFMIQAFNGPVDNVLIQTTRVNGGDYGVQFTGGVTNGRLRNCQFGQQYLYGPWATNVTNSATQICGNRWLDEDVVYNASQRGQYMTVNSVTNSACPV